MYRFTNILMILALSVGFQSVHAASPWWQGRSVTVHFADLDLSHSQGVSVLYTRLKGAAESTCAPLDELELARHMRFQACVQSAISRAVVTVNRPALTAYFEARTGVHSGTDVIARN